jgi:hypothetical protein
MIFGKQAAIQETSIRTLFVIVVVVVAVPLFDTRKPRGTIAEAEAQREQTTTVRWARLQDIQDSFQTRRGRHIFLQ